jgi:hypothetical protein
MLPTRAQGPSTRSEYVKHITNITGVPVFREQKRKTQETEYCKSIWICETLDNMVTETSLLECGTM